MLWSSVDELQPRLSFLKNLTRNTMGAPNSERLNTVWHGDVTTGSTCVHASKNHPKKKGLKQTQLTAAQDQVFLLHPHARGTTLRHLHHTWCVCFPPQLLPVISVSRNIKHHILHQSWRVDESRWFNSPSISPPQSVALVHVQTLHRHPWRWWIPMAVPMTRVHLSGTKRRSCSGIRSWHGLESRRSWCCVEMSTQYMGEKNGWTQALESLNLSWFSRLPF